MDSKLNDDLEELYLSPLSLQIPLQLLLLRAELLILSRFLHIRNRDGYLDLVQDLLQLVPLLGSEVDVDFDDEAYHGGVLRVVEDCLDLDDVLAEPLEGEVPVSHQLLVGRVLVSHYVMATKYANRK